MSLLTGVVGIYGVIAYAAAQRTRAIGIRMALGAQIAGRAAGVVERIEHPAAARHDERHG